MNKTSDLQQVVAGFLPLTDCMILAIAREKGFAERHGIDLVLSRQQSWASIRDHMTVGHFHVAQMLAPMPIAFNAGLVPFSVPVIAPMALGLGGNAITLHRDFWSDLVSLGADEKADPLRNGEALKLLCESRTDAKLRFGVVHPFSSHNLELRYWLAACGIDPEQDVEMVIVPPPLMPEALEQGRIDGYCVGEPWNTLSVKQGTGVILTTKSAIWHSSPEKVLGVNADWAKESPETLSLLIRSLHEAASWCGDKENHQELARILSRSDYVAIDHEMLLPAISGQIETVAGSQVAIEDFLLPYERAATFPWQSHALWFYSQMVRWGQLGHTPQNEALALQSYRPDLYRHALEATEASVPAANMKVEGSLKAPIAVGSTGRLILGPDGFFDGTIFDPDQLEDYLASYDR